MKTISKILSIVLCLAMVMALFVVGASADEIAKVTSIAVGDTIVFMNIDGSKAAGSQNSGNYRNSVDAAQAVKFTVEAGSDTGSFSFKDPSGNYLSWSDPSGGNKLYNSNTKNAASSWTVEFDASGNATIKNVGTPARQLQYNSSSPRFACYTGSQQKVTIYKVGGAACTHEGTGRVVVRDADKHWNSCQECGTIVGEKTAHTAGTCSCGFVSHVAEPVVGTTYKAGTYQGTLDKFVYLTGAESGNYLATTANFDAAADVFVETVTGGYRFYVMVEGVKNYIDVIPSAKSDGSGYYYNAQLVTEPTCTWTWNADHDTFVTVMTTGYDEPTEHYVGTYGNYETISSSKLSYAATSFPLHLYATANNDDSGNQGGTGTEHTHNMVTKYDNTHHWTECSCGEKTDKIGHTLNNSKCACGYEKAAVVGYYKVTNGKLTDGKYVLVVSETKVAAGIMNDKKWVTASNPTISGNQVANPTDCVWTLDVDGDNVTITDPNGKSITNSGTNIIEGTDTWKWKYENGMFYFYKEAEEGKEPRYLSSNPKAGEGKENFFRAYYLTPEPDSYGNFYYAGFDLYKYSTSGNPSTGDNSVVSVAVAAAVLSVMGAAVLVSKKKEF